MSAPLLYVTGTNTAVGKTTLSRLLLQRARERTLRIGAMKPFCTGGRDDAEQLHALQTAGLTLDELNPFHFIEPVTPYLAARNENRAITLSQTVDAIKKIGLKDYPLLIEGAGGLMSPLGDHFTLLDIINELPGKICVVAPNILGVLNSALLTHQALKATRAEVVFALMNSAQPDISSGSNIEVIKDWSGAMAFEFPFLSKPGSLPVVGSISRLLDEILDWAFT